MKTEPYTKEEVEASWKIYNEATKRVPKTMGPYSPFWECPHCKATSLSPLNFPHKSECDE